MRTFRFMATLLIILIRINKHFFLKILFIYSSDRDRDSQLVREYKQGEWERKKQAHSRGA